MRSDITFWWWSYNTQGLSFSLVESCHVLWVVNHIAVYDWRGVIVVDVVHVLGFLKLYWTAESSAEDRQEPSSYAGLEGYRPPETETTSSIYTPMNHVDPASLPRQHDRASSRRDIETNYAGLNGAPTLPPPRPDANSPDYLTLIG